MNAFDDFSEVDICIAVSLSTFREVLADISNDGRHWWIESSTNDALKGQSITVAFGFIDLLGLPKTKYFRLPVLDHSQSMEEVGPLLIIDAEAITATDSPYDEEETWTSGDIAEGFTHFYSPLYEALTRKLRDAA